MVRMKNSDRNAAFKAFVVGALEKEGRGARAKLARSINKSKQDVTKFLNHGRDGGEDERRAMAAFFNVEYDLALEIGRALLEGRTPPEPEPRFLNADEMSERGFFAVPFSSDMKLAAGGGGTIPITDDESTSAVIVHGPSLGLHNSKNLQAFRVGGDSMDPLIAEGGLVLADLKHNDVRHLINGGIYVLCWDLGDGECAVKRLKWETKGKKLFILSENKFYDPITRHVDEVKLIGLVIWSWREFKYKA